MLCYVITSILHLPWHKIIESIKYRLLLLRYTALLKTTNLHICYCMTSSLFNRIAALALHLSSLSLDHQHHPLYE